MARGTITPSLLTTTGVLATPGTITSSDGAYIDVAGLAGASVERLIIQVKYTSASAGTVHFLPGDNPPAFLAGQGTTSMTYTAGTSEKLLVLEGAKVLQSDNTINVDVVGSDVVMRVYAMPKTV